MSDGLICTCDDELRPFDERSTRGELGITSRCRAYAADQVRGGLCASCTFAGHDPGRYSKWDGSWAEIDPGPYMSDSGEGSEIYLPVGLWSWPSAQRNAAYMARVQLGYSDAARSRFVGKQDCRLDTIDEGHGIEGVPCYVFEAYERD